jgi:hypothetical protein
MKKMLIKVINFFRKLIVKDSIILEYTLQMRGDLFNERIKFNDDSIVNVHSKSPKYIGLYSYSKDKEIINFIPIPIEGINDFCILLKQTAQTVKDKGRN